ncbi:MAG: tyrosine-type recombinase/integrase [Pseudobacter sp.]|uniref:tyrosine-type recombinase/integrase n=1 Tax=Pseudobacter sp. TaxID=2045420 RepID=UPI003F7CD5D2
MLYPIQPGCYKPRADGFSNIHIQYCFTSAKKPLLDTQIVIPAAYWDKTKKEISPDLPLEHGLAAKLNVALQQQMELVGHVIKYAIRNNIEDRAEFVKRFYSPDLDIFSLDEKVKKAEQEKIEEEKKIQDAIKADVYKQIELYILAKQKNMCKQFPAMFRNMAHLLKCYQTARKVTITFDSFTGDFYQDFVDFLSYEHKQTRRKKTIIGLKINTVGKVVNHLRRFLNHRISKKVIAPIDFTEWESVGEDSDAVYLTWEEIEKIYTVDLRGHPHLIPYRNDFVLGCLTGLRFSDFSALEMPDARGDYLYKKQFKSYHRVVIPLRKAAKEILQGRFNEGYVTLTNAEFNRHIKTVCRLAGIVEVIKHTYKKGSKRIEEIREKCDWVTTHTCRRSFCTNEFLAGTPVELIMKISGHKSLRDFYRYIKITPEEAAQKMKEIWEKRSAEQGKYQALF